MKKLTAGIFATLLAVVSADGAYAAIASKGYVDEKVGTVTTELGNKADKTAIADMLTKTEAGTTYATKESIADMETKSNASATYATKSEVSSLSSEAEKIANRVTTVSDASDNTHYPTAKAVWDVVQAETEGIASTADLTALTTRVGTLETASKTHATKTELATKQDKNMGTGAANRIVTTDASGNITSSATIDADKVSGLADVATTGAYGDLSGTPSLGTLASKSTITSAEITDGTIAEADLNTTINASLDKADSALQKTAADKAYAVKTLETQVGTVSKENMGTTTATTVVAGVKEAIDAAKAADTKAGSAASAASTAQSAAEAAQADVDTLETTVSGQGTRLTAAEGEIDSIQSEMENMATSETVSGLQSTVTNLQSTKQDKTDNTLTTTNKTVVGAINEVKATADKKQDKLTGTIGGSMQPVYLNNGTITAGTALGTLATKSKVTNAEVDDAALAQSKISGLATSLAAKLTTPPTSAKGEDGLFVLTYDGTNFQWEDIARTVAE